MPHTPPSRPGGLRRTGLLLLTAALLGGCVTASRVNYLTEQRYKPTRSAADVRLYVSDVVEPHVRIAQVNSFAAPTDDDETRRRQLEDLRQRAWKLGADAVVEVRRLRNRGQGFVIDESVPFRAYRQGTYQQYFLRGVAIRYSENPAAPPDEGTEAPPPASTAAISTRGIPVQETIETESPYEAPPLPRTP